MLGTIGFLQNTLAAAKSPRYPGQHPVSTATWTPYHQGVNFKNGFLGHYPEAIQQTTYEDKVVKEMGYFDHEFEFDTNELEKDIDHNQYYNNGEDDDKIEFDEQDRIELEDGSIESDFKVTKDNQQQYYEHVDTDNDGKERHKRKSRSINNQNQYFNTLQQQGLPQQQWQQPQNGAYPVPNVNTNKKSSWMSKIMSPFKKDTPPQFQNPMNAQGFANGVSNTGAHQWNGPQAQAWGSNAMNGAVVSNQWNKQPAQGWGANAVNRAGGPTPWNGQWQQKWGAGAGQQARINASPLSRVQQSINWLQQLRQFTSWQSNPFLPQLAESHGTTNNRFQLQAQGSNKDDKDGVEDLVEALKEKMEEKKEDEERDEKVKEQLGDLRRYALLVIPYFIFPRDTASYFVATELFSVWLEKLGVSDEVNLLFALFIQCVDVRAFARGRWKYVDDYQVNWYQELYDYTLTKAGVEDRIRIGSQYFFQQSPKPDWEDKKKRRKKRSATSATDPDGLSQSNLQDAGNYTFEDYEDLLARRTKRLVSAIESFLRSRLKDAGLNTVHPTHEASYKDKLKWRKKSLDVSFPELSLYSADYFQRFRKMVTLI